jgi:hypothetical protein
MFHTNVKWDKQTNKQKQKKRKSLFVLEFLEKPRIFISYKLDTTSENRLRMRAYQNAM